jgi:hypothetical protein
MDCSLFETRGNPRAKTVIFTSNRLEKILNLFIAVMDFSRYPDNSA